MSTEIDVTKQQELINNLNHAITQYKHTLERIHQLRIELLVLEEEINKSLSNISKDVFKKWS